MSQVRPPVLFVRFFIWYCRPELQEVILGDMEEQFMEEVGTYGVSKAKRRFIWTVFRFFRPGIIKQFSPFNSGQKLNQLGIMKNHLIISWRFLRKNKRYSLLNIGGLSASMFVAILIGLWLHDELTFNHSHQHYRDIAQVLRKDKQNNQVLTGSAQPTGLGTILSNEYKSQFKHVAMVRQRLEERVLANKNIKFTESGYFVQPDFPEMFSLNMIKGQRSGLSDLKSIILSETTAHKLFGGENPINQVVVMNNRSSLKVTGVFEDLPSNSKFSEADYFAPLDLYLEGWSDLNIWDNYNMWIFVQLPENRSFSEASDVIKDAMLPHLDDESFLNKPKLFLHPMDKWHLHSEFENGEYITSPMMRFVWFYVAIGIFVVVLALINFINLSTARSEKRAKEVGIRKAMGSHRNQLISQFLTESFLLTFIAGFISVVLAYITLPWFNYVSSKQLVLPVDQVIFWLCLAGFVGLAALASGSYPALYLSSFNPVNALKVSFNPPGNQVTPRKILVVFQFTVSITLIIGSLLVKKQIDHAKNRPVGYSKEGLITLRPGSSEYFGKYDVLRNELIKTGMVKDMAESNYAITSTLGWNHLFTWPGQTPGFDPAFNTIYVTHEYGNTVGWQFVSGRDFSREISSDKQGVIINESAAKLMGLENPVGLSLHYDQDWLKNKNFKILGVVKDQIKGSPFENTHPAITFLTEKDQQWLFIRLKKNVSPVEAIPKIGEAFYSIIPSAPFDFKFVDEEYGAKFKAEEKTANIAGVFAILAICISCLGLLGLVSYVVEKRTKEIGIRKVLGASILQIWQLLSQDFLVLVVIAGIFALPITYFIISNWLKQYDYIIDLSLETYVIAFLGVVSLAIVTLSANTLRIAKMNPVKSLRDE